jgi:hypothetical protein
MGSLIDLFRLYSNHFMKTPNDENFLITMHPKLLSLCTISHHEKDNEAFFGHFRLSTLALFKKSVAFIPQKFLRLTGRNEAIKAKTLFEPDQWQVKIYSRLKYLEKVSQNSQ